MSNIDICRPTRALTPERWQELRTKALALLAGSNLATLTALDDLFDDVVDADGFDLAAIDDAADAIYGARMARVMADMSAP